MSSEARRKAGRDYYARNREKQLAKKKQLYIANPALCAEKARKWEDNNPEKAMLLNCRASARKRGHSCELTLEQVKAIIAPMRCTMTGIALQWAKGPWRPSLDRLNNDEGYSIQNVRLVCWAYNSMRGEWEDTVVLTMAQGLVATAFKM